LVKNTTFWAKAKKRSSKNTGCKISHSDILRAAVVVALFLFDRNDL
jgi:hypothetical protein